jgi:hypothetical protein
MGGELWRDVELPVWWVVMVKALCLGSYCDSVSISERVMAPRDRTLREVMPREASRKMKLCYILVGEVYGRLGGRRTATMLKKPMTMHRMPEATRRRQKGRPSDSWLVACLFMLPSMLRPMVIMAQPRVTKPWDGLRSGQLRAKKLRNSEHSETMRKRPAIAVMT